MQIIASILCVGLFFLFSKAQLHTPGGRCNLNARGIEGLNTSRAAGQWVVKAKIPVNSQPGGCPTFDLAETADGGFDVTFGQYLGDSLDNDQFSITPAADAEGRAEFTTQWNVLDLNTDFRILATDYDGYMILYSCRDYCEGKTEYSWLTSRFDSDPSVLGTAVGIIYGNNVNFTEFSGEDASCPQLG